MVRIIKEAMKTNYVSMIQTLMNCDFLRHFLPLVGFCHQRLWHDLSGEHMMRLRLCDLVTFCKSTLQNDRDKNNGTRIRTYLIETLK